MELRGISEVNSVINSFIGQFGLRADMGSDFSYYPLSDCVHYSFLMDEQSNRTFEMFLQKNFPEINVNLFLWSLLHEVGHHMTIDEWSEEEQDSFDDRKEELSYHLYMEENEGSDDELYFEYYSLPDEFEATSWAAEFIEENLEEVKEFWERLSKAIWNFAELNQLEIG